MTGETDHKLRGDYSRMRPDYTVDQEWDRYPEADHGFHCDERPAFHPESSADAWARTLAFLGDHQG